MIKPGQKIKNNTVKGTFTVKEIKGPALHTEEGPAFITDNCTVIDDNIWTDEKHLTWIFNRMVERHDEDPNLDYMIRFKQIIEKL